MKRRGMNKRRRKLSKPPKVNLKTLARRNVWAKKHGFIDYQHYLDYKRGDEL